MVVARTHMNVHTHKTAHTRTHAHALKNKYMASPPLCSDGSRDVHGGAGTGDATWLEGGTFGDADVVL